MTVSEAVLAMEQGAAVVFCHPWYTRGKEVVFPRIAEIAEQRDRYGRSMTVAILYESERCRHHVQPEYLRRAEEDERA